MLVNLCEVDYNFNLFGEARFEENIWWFQEGALCHQLRAVSNRLRELFGNQLISLNREIEWPPRSPEFNPV